MIENLFWLGFVGAALALVFALIQRNKVMAYSEGTDTMKKIAQSIRDGANAYLKHQYTTVAKVFVVVFIVLLIMAGRDALLRQELKGAVLVLPQRPLQEARLGVVFKRL